MLRDISTIFPDPKQPRQNFDMAGLESLAHNIKLEGIIHPIEIDESGMIIVGERRFRASKLAGLTQIPVTINKKPLDKYTRLRRQMSENLHQSAARNGGESMNPIDTARGWVRLYELKTGKKYQPGGHLMGELGRGIKGPFLEIAEEIGASKETVWELLQLLDQSDEIIKAIASGTPRTYIREINNAPEQIREKLFTKVVEGGYASRDQIRREITIAKRLPSLIALEFQRKETQESIETNRILNSVIALGLALEKQPFSEIDKKEANIVLNHLHWLQEKLEAYLTSEAEVVE